MNFSNNAQSEESTFMSGKPSVPSTQQWQWWRNWNINRMSTNACAAIGHNTKEFRITWWRFKLSLLLLEGMLPSTWLAETKKTVYFTCNVNKLLILEAMQYVHYSVDRDHPQHMFFPQYGTKFHTHTK